MSELERWPNNWELLTGGDAARACPRRVLRMFGPHVHALPFDVQIDAAYGLRRLQAQQLLIERGVLHGCPSLAGHTILSPYSR